MFAASSDEFNFSAQRVCELLELAFGEFEVATIPRTLDEVTVGTADRIRCDNVDTVFLLGAVDGNSLQTRLPAEYSPSLSEKHCAKRWKARSWAVLDCSLRGSAPLITRV